MDDRYRPLASASRLFIGANMIMIGGVFWFIAFYLSSIDERAAESDLTGFATAFFITGGLILAWGTLLIMRVLRRGRR